jgi:hypothetical protein
LQHDYASQLKSHVLGNLSGSPKIYGEGRWEQCDGLIPVTRVPTEPGTEAQRVCAGLPLATVHRVLSYRPAAPARHHIPLDSARSPHAAVAVVSAGPSVDSPAPRGLREADLFDPLGGGLRWAPARHQHRDESCRLRRSTRAPCSQIFFDLPWHHHPQPSRSWPSENRQFPNAEAGRSRAQAPGPARHSHFEHSKRGLIVAPPAGDPLDPIS